MHDRYRVAPTLPEEEAQAWAPYLAARGWSRTEEDDWQFWLAGTYPDRSFYQALRADQWISRIPGIGALAVKRDLCLNARWARRWAGGQDRDHPIGFLLPAERQRWLAAAHDHEARRWLLKPQASRWGERISLVQRLEDVPETGDWLVQEYVAQPHLIDGLKYHLRFYVLLTSLDPLVFYVHDLATCLFATRPFTMDPTRLGDRFVHLTNVAVQEQNVGAGPSRKWLIDSYRGRLRQDGLDDEQLMEDVRSAITRLVIAGREQALLESRGYRLELETCFDLLSVDVLVDADLRPWILEFNAGVPMTFPAWIEQRPDGSDPVTDAERIRTGLIGDLLDLLGFGVGLPQRSSNDENAYWLHRDRGERRRAGGWRRLWPDESAALYTRRFPALRPLDRLLASASCDAVEPVTPRLMPISTVTALPFAEGLALHDERRRRLHLLDATAAVVWLAMADGLDVEEIVGELAAVFPEAPLAKMHSDVWGLLTAWAQRGLVLEEGVDSPAASPADTDADTEADTEAVSASLVVAACSAADALFVALDSAVLAAAAPLPNGVSYAPCALPHPGVSILTLVDTSPDGEPSLVRSSPIQALDELLASTAKRYAPSVEDARALLDWLEQLQCLEVGTAVPHLSRTHGVEERSPGAPGKRRPPEQRRRAEASDAPGDIQVQLAAVGDVQLGRDLTEKLQTHGDAYPFARIADLLRATDVRIANLESALTRGGQAREKAVVFRGLPEHAAALREAGFDVVSVANNHIADYGDDGVVDTLGALATAGVAAAGSRRNGTAPFRAARLARGGLELSFLSFNDFVEGSAGDHRLVALADTATLRRHIAAERSLCDLVIVSLHFGLEHRTQPSDRQRLLARTAVEAGAALVLGHHPHVLQGLERHGDGLIAYSLGNCVFDLRHNPLHVTERAFDSAILEVTLGLEGVVGARLRPIVIDLEEDRPRPASAIEAGRIVERMRVLSNCWIAPSGLVEWQSS